MATGPFELYPVISQIAGAFAGFGSLASGLGQRRGGDDARMDAYRLEHMLEASLWVTLLGLLPGTLAGLFADERDGVHASAVVGMIAIMAHAPRAMVHARRIRQVAGFSWTATTVNVVCMWGAFVVFAVCALGIPSGRLANLYLLALVGMLGSTVMLFSRVIVSMLKRHHATTDGSA